MRPVRLRTQTRQKKRSDTRRYILLGALVAMMSVGLYLLQVRHFTSVADTSNPSQRQKATETNPAKEVKTDSSAKLQTAVDAWLESHGSRYRVVAQSLDDSTAATYHADVPIVPASTYKLFVAYAAYHQIEAGQLSLATTLSNGMTIEQCLKKAVVQSDNACAEAIGFKIGWSTVDELIAAAGFSQTRLNNYAVDGGYTGDKQSSAADLGNLLAKLYQGKLVDAEHTDSLLGYMRQQVYRSGIPAGSDGSVVADKVGFLSSYTHDAALVYGPKHTYVLVVMSETGDNWVNIKSLAQLVYNAFLL